MSNKRIFKLLLIVMIMAMTTCTAAFSAVSSATFTEFFMKELVKGNRSMAYLTLNANMPKESLAGINKKLYTFYVTDNMKMASTPTTKLNAYADHQVIGSLGVFATGGTAYIVDTESLEWKKTLHLNLVNQHVYGLKDLFRSDKDYKQEIAKLLNAKNAQDNNSKPIDTAQMITDGTFEILPEGVKFYQLSKLGHASHPYQYFSLTLQWYELDHLINKQGELWQVLKGNIDTSPLHPVCVTAPEGSILWGYENAQGKMVIKAQYDSATKFDRLGFARVTLPRDPQVVLIIDQRNKTIGKFHRLVEIVSPSTAVMYTMDDISMRLVTLDTQKVLQKNIASSYTEGVAVFSLGKAKDNRFGYVDRFGKVTIQPKYLEAWPFFSGKAIVKLETGKYAQIDYSGKILLSYSKKLVPNEGYNSILIYELKGKYGAINTSNKGLLPANYLWITYIPDNGQFILRTAKGEYLADITGKPMSEYYQSINYVGENQYNATSLKGVAIKIKGNGDYSGVYEWKQ